MPLRSFFRSDMVRSWQTDQYLFLHHFYRYEKARDVRLVFLSYVSTWSYVGIKEYLLGLMHLDLVSIILEWFFFMFCLDLWSLLRLLSVSPSLPFKTDLSKRCFEVLAGSLWRTKKRLILFLGEFLMQPIILFLFIWIFLLSEWIRSENAMGLFRLAIPRQKWEK